ncbi:MAG: transposase [Bacteroidia bacterium]
MSSKYQIHGNYPYFLTLTVVAWIDVFTRNEYRQEIIDSIKYCQKHKGLSVFAWCLMTNHLHLVAKGDESNSLSDILRDMKTHTSKAITRAIENNPRESRSKWMLNQFAFEANKFTSKNMTYHFWQSDNHSEEIHTNQFLDQKIDYTHYNPVRAGFVAEPQHYLYSSAIDYAGGKGLIDVIIP